jgi:carbonic anhydrase
LHGGVTWFVLKTPLAIAIEQINAFAKLDPHPHDVRLQPLSRRRREGESVTEE